MKNDELIESYKNFLASGKTERECVDFLILQAKNLGWKNFSETQNLQAGDRVYFVNRDKALAFFIIGSQDFSLGMNVLGAHIDSPRLDVKQNPLYEKDFVVYLNTHYYGGIKKYQWVTLPLAIHGVVCLKNGNRVKVVIGERESDPVFCISDILPHLAQKQMKENAANFIPGEALDVIVGSEIPQKEKPEEENSESETGEKSKKKNQENLAKKNILKILKSEYGIEESDFLSAELEIVPAGKPRDLGFDKSMILAYGQDDRSCAFASAQAIFDAATPNKTLCCLCVDKEEIGSVGATGMASRFFENCVAEIAAKLCEKNNCELMLRRCLSASKMLSSDVNAAYDPLNGDLFDRDNASFLGGGIVFCKYTGSRGKSGASDANPEFIAQLRNLLDGANVKYQMAELGKVDQGGGGTIAYLAAKYGMDVLDAGVAVLSMHAPWEITAKEDIIQSYNAYKTFLTLE